MILVYSVGLILKRFVRTTFKLLHKPEARGLVTLTGLIVGAGVVFYRFVEGLSWVDALYFTIITLTTVGYGDISPQTPAGKLFTVVYIVVGLGIIGSFIALFAEYQREHVLSIPLTLARQRMTLTPCRTTRPIQTLYNQRIPN